MDLVVALLLVLDEDGQLAQVDVPRRVVVLPRDRAQVQHFKILRERQHDLVDVGELIACRIDEDAVRVALERPRRRVDRRHRLPRRQHREIRVDRPVVPAEEQAHPAVELRVLDLLQVVRGREPAHVPVGAPLAGEVGRAGQDVGEHVVGLQELEPHRVGVDLLDHALLAVDGQGCRRRRHEILVPVDVLEPEHEIIGGEGLAVAPLHAPAQVHEPRLAAVLHLETLREVRHDLVARVVPEHQMIRARAAAEAVPEVRRTGEAGAPHPAVLADLLQRLDDQRILADTLGDRWQFARLDEGRELR